MKKSEYTNIADLENTHFWYRANREFSLDLIANNLPLSRRLRILDIGCGAGGTTTALKKFGSVTGIDCHPLAIQLASRHHINHLYLANSNHLPFPDSSFHLVTCFDVLYHQQVNLDQTISEIFRVLKPRGTLLIREPAFSFLAGSHDVVVGGARRFSAGQIKRLLVPMGFSIKKLTYFNLISLLPLLAFRKIKRQSSSDIHPIWNPLNQLGYYMLRAESKIAKYLNLPFGSSIYCVCIKKS